MDGASARRSLDNYPGGAAALEEDLLGEAWVRSMRLGRSRAGLQHA